MRRNVSRVSGFVLIGVGLFGLVLAVLLPTVVVSGSKKIPLNLNITLVSTGQAQVLSATTGKLETVDLRATRVVRSDSKASNSKYATVNETLCIVVVQGDTPNCFQQSPAAADRDPRLLSTTTDRVTVDRKSAEAVSVPKYQESINNSSTMSGQAVKHEGIAYAFPIDTKKQTYQFFEPDLNKAFPATFQGTEKIKGLNTYKFVSVISGQPFLINGTFPGNYDDTRTVWVEPRTGVIVKGTETQKQTMADGTVALNITQPLTFDNTAQNYQAHFAKTKINQLKMAQLWGPLFGAIIGIAALAGGVLLLRDRRGRHGSIPPGHPEFVNDPNDLLHRV